MYIVLKIVNKGPIQSSTKFLHYPHPGFSIYWRHTLDFNQKSRNRTGEIIIITKQVLFREGTKLIIMRNPRFLLRR